MPIFVPYLPLHTLHGHVKSVSCLAFSPTGNRLASGGDDGNVIIWEPDQGKILHRVILHGPVTCIVWDPDDSRTRLFVGCGDGVLTVMETFKAQEPSNSVLTGTKASVYAIAADRYTGHISVGLGSEVHIAKEVGPKKYATFKILPSPEPLPQTSPNADQRIRARALEFMTKGTCLLVAYLNHGVVCWDKETAVQLWCIVPIHSHRLIGHAALSPDEKTVLISNLSDGADLYLVGQSHPSNLFKSPSNSQTNVPVQVIFFGGGNSVLCGSVVGCVHIWNVKTGECEQVLDHSGDIVQAVSAYDSIGRSLIVTATSGTSEKTYIKVWKAQTRFTVLGYLRWSGALIFHTLFRLIRTTQRRLSRISDHPFLVVILAIFAGVVTSFAILHVRSSDSRPSPHEWFLDFVASVSTSTSDLIRAATEKVSDSKERMRRKLLDAVLYILGVGADELRVPYNAAADGPTIIYL